MRDMETTTNPEAKMTRTAHAENPIIAAINSTADDHCATVHLPLPLAYRLIEMVGGERVTEGAGRWTFPDGFWTWDDEEATRYALEVLPDVAE